MKSIDCLSAVRACIHFVALTTTTTTTKAQESVRVDQFWTLVEMCNFIDFLLLRRLQFPCDESAVGSCVVVVVRVRPLASVTALLFCCFHCSLVKYMSVFIYVYIYMHTAVIRLVWVVSEFQVSRVTKKYVVIKRLELNTSWILFYLNV